MAANYGTMTQAELVQALNAANAAQAAQVRAFYDAAAATNGGWQRMTQGADTIPAAALAAYPAVASALAALENNVYQDQATQIGAALGQLATSPQSGGMDPRTAMLDYFRNNPATAGTTYNVSALTAADLASLGLDSSGRLIGSGAYAATPTSTTPATGASTTPTSAYAAPVTATPAATTPTVASPAASSVAVDSALVPSSKTASKTTAATTAAATSAYAPADSVAGSASNTTASTAAATPTYATSPYLTPSATLTRARKRQYRPFQYKNLASMYQGFLS